MSSDCGHFYGVCWGRSDILIIRWIRSFPFFIRLSASCVSVAIVRTVPSVAISIMRASRGIWIVPEAVSMMTSSSKIFSTTQKSVVWLAPSFRIFVFMFSVCSEDFVLLTPEFSLADALQRQRKREEMARN